MLTVSLVMVTDLEVDQLDNTLACVAHLAWALTLKVPGLLQECEALVEDDQLELSPFSQKNRY